MVSGSRFGGNRITPIGAPPQTEEQQKLLQAQVDSMEAQETRKRGETAAGKFLDAVLEEEKLERQVPRDIASEARKEKRDVRTAYRNKGLDVLSKAVALAGKMDANTADAEKWVAALLARPFTRQATFTDGTNQIPEILKPYGKTLDPQTRIAHFNAILGAEKVAPEDRAAAIQALRNAEGQAIPAEILEIVEGLKKRQIHTTNTNKLTPTQRKELQEAKEKIVKSWNAGVRKRYRALVDYYNVLREVAPTLPEYEQALAAEHAFNQRRVNRNANRHSEEKRRRDRQDRTTTSTPAPTTPKPETPRPVRGALPRAGYLQPPRGWKGIRLNSSGPEVHSLQLTLTTAGLMNPNEVNEGHKYDQSTMAAIWRFQENHMPGVKPDGIYGPSTHKALVGYLKNNDITIGGGGNATGVSDERVAATAVKSQQVHGREAQRSIQEATRNAPTIEAVDADLTSGLTEVARPTVGPVPLRETPGRTRDEVIQKQQAHGYDAQSRLMGHADLRAGRLEDETRLLDTAEAKAIYNAAMTKVDVSTRYGEAFSQSKLQSTLDDIKLFHNIRPNDPNPSKTINDLIQKNATAMTTTKASQREIAGLSDSAARSIAAFSFALHDEVTHRAGWKERNAREDNESDTAYKAREEKYIQSVLDSTVVNARRGQVNAYLLKAGVTRADIIANAHIEIYEVASKDLADADRRRKQDHVTFGETLNETQVTFDIQTNVFRQLIIEPIKPHERVALYNSPNGMAAAEDLVVNFVNDSGLIDTYYSTFNRTITKMRRDGKPITDESLKQARARAVAAVKALARTASRRPAYKKAREGVLREIR
jgi:peptidoglycan hydrolase-like protein with peptidoglycan-binding domain